MLDLTTYALCKGKVDGLSDAVTAIGTGFTYKGTVSTSGDLPASPTDGDMYVVGSDAYYYNGSDWVALSITTTQINSLF